MNSYPAKNNSIRFLVALVLVPIVSLLPISSISGGSSIARELAVYRIHTYASAYDSNAGVHKSWKMNVSNVTINCDSQGNCETIDHTEQDPYEDFWDSIYTNCASRYCAHTSSARFKDNQVTVNLMTSEAETTSERGWSGSDMVFFDGHNTQIKPQWPHSFSLWRPVSGAPAAVTEVSISDWQDWGTSSEPYIYHAEPVTDASATNGYSVFYTHNHLTSVLVGKDFDKYDDWTTENTYKGIDVEHDNTLGPETEWIIANGCNAVTVANQSGDTAIPLGASAWGKSWNSLHLVLGHYNEIYFGKMPNLVHFSNHLKSGMSIKQAYFSVHAELGDDSGQYHQSAISISPYDCCSWITPIIGPPILICPPQGCTNNRMNDKWYNSFLSVFMESLIENNDPNENLFGYYITDWESPL